MACPACGGGGGGPFGRAGSPWDVETYECPRCRGSGVVSGVDPALARPLAKGASKPPSVVVERRGVVSTRPAPRRAPSGTGGQDE